MIRPEDFGAAADGTTDDRKAIQAALDRAALDRGAGGTVLLAGVYAVGGTLSVPSGTTLQGFGGAIRMRADDVPILASAAWLGRGPLKGRTRIAGLRLEGTGRGAHQDGVVLHDFWSELADLEVVNTGGRGIVLTASDRTGARGPGTLVENRVRRCIVRDSRDSAFALGEPANGKLTDGEVSDCIAALAEGVRAPALTLGHAAGWTLRNLHTYGGRPEVAVEIRQGYFTRLSDLYCEGFTRVGLDLVQVQTQVSVAAAQIVAAEVGPEAAFIALSAHRDFAGPTVGFTNVALTNLGGGAPAALSNPDGKVAVTGLPFVIGGAGAARVAPGGPAGASVSSGTAPGGTAARRSFTWSGRAAQALRLATRRGDEVFAEAFEIVIAARSADGALTTQFAGMVHWSHAKADTRAVLVDLVPFGTPVGFAQPPAAAFRLDGDLIVLTLSFQPVASGPGQISVG